MILTFFAFISLSSFSQWENIDFSVSQNASIESFNDRIFIGTWSEGLYYSDDDGISWEKSSHIPDINIRRLAQNSNNSVLYTAGTFGSVYKSVDNGDNWEDISLTQLLYNSHDIYGLLTFNDKIFAAVFGQGMFVSSDEGITWDSIQNGLGGYTETGNGRYIYDIEKLGDRIFIAGGNGLWYSDDEGENWQRSDAFTDGSYLMEMAVMNNKLYVGTDYTGVFVSEDAGESWSEISNGSINGVRSFKVIKDEYLHVGTLSGKVLLYEGNSNWSEVNDSYTPGTHIIMSMCEHTERLYIASFMINNNGEYAVRSYSSPLFIGLREIDKLADFNCYIDPSNSKLIINSPDEFERIELYNIHGQTIYINNTVFNHLYELDTQELKAGLYIVKISNGQAFHTNKIIIHN